MNHVALRSRHLDILSICTGGGGLDLGIGLAVPGARTVCMVEREAFAVAQLVSAQRQGLLHPAPVWSDARTFDGRRWRGCVDGLIGGIPCQPHSLAGRKQGSLDARDLWSDARRIIVQSRCWFVLIENVGGMLSAGADEVAGAERVWRDLRKLGFAVEGGLFTAAEVGASHERERVFVLGVADSIRPGLERFQPGGIARPWLEGCPTQRGGGALVDTSLVGRGEGRAEPSLRSRRDAASRSDSAMVDTIGGGYHGRSHDAFRGSFFGDAAERTGGSPVGSMGNADIVELRRQPPAGELAQLQPEHGDGAGPLFPPGPSDLSSWAGVLASAPELEPAFRRVADGLASRLDTARVDRLRMLGNGVVPLQAAYGFRTLATRLAGRGSTGAARLVRMMEENA